MTLKKSSRNPFASMFWHSVKMTCFVQILTLAALLVYGVINTISAWTYGTYYSPKLSKIGYFWDILLSSPSTTPVIFVCGILAAIVLFQFAQSKKQCNVIFSLGLSRKKLFLAKYLGGILPLTVILIIAAIVEIISNLILGFKVDFLIIHFALLAVATLLSIYTLAFTITAIAMAFSGNFIEGGIFTFIMMTFPNTAGRLFGSMCISFTYGGSDTYDGSWSLFRPFSVLNDLIDRITDPSLVWEAGQYYLATLYTGKIQLNIFDWSGAIMNFTCSAIILAIAVTAFQKRKNEISGSFGKSKVLNEICGAMAALYPATTVLGKVAQSNQRNGKAVELILFIMTFIAVYLTFKMIFGYKRKRVLIQSVKRLAAYTAAFALITVIFSTGLLGYSSYVPDADDVTRIEIALEIENPYATANDNSSVSRSEEYGYAQMTSNYYPYYTASGHIFGIPRDDGCMANYRKYCFEEKDDIKKIVETHKSLARSGKIKPNADNACGFIFEIEYTISNNKTVKRFYSTMSTENAAKLLCLNDIFDLNDAIFSYFQYPVTKIDGYDYQTTFSGFIMYSKDLKKSCYIDLLDPGLQDSITVDLQKQSAQQLFFHKPEDELGVLCFTPEATSDSIEPNCDPDFSVSISNNRCIVITKDMVNTIKYLTDNNLMQYFKSDITANDVQRIKIATRAESLGKCNADMLPLFAAGYANAAEIESNDDMREQEFHSFANHVGGSIEDKATIQTVLDNAMLYGFNDNSDRIVEVTYNDGSIATYAIKSDVYDKLNIK